MFSRWLIVGSLLASFSTAALAGDSATAPHGLHRVPTADPVARLELDRDAVHAKLARARTDNLNRFRAYRANGVFPTNTILRGKLNVWRDADGHLCAAATIINQSGEWELVQQTADNDNFVRLATVTDGPLMNWMLTSGLTQQEIAMIQEPFMGVGGPNRDEPIGVDVDRAAPEHARLVAKYAQVDASLVKARADSLDVATDRLMANPSLAAAFMRGDKVVHVDYPVPHEQIDPSEPNAPTSNHATRLAQPPRS